MTTEVDLLPVMADLRLPLSRFLLPVAPWWSACLLYVVVNRVLAVRVVLQVRWKVVQLVVVQVLYNADRIHTIGEFIRNTVCLVHDIVDPDLPIAAAVNRSRNLPWLDAVSPGL